MLKKLAIAVNAAVVVSMIATGISASTIRDLGLEAKLMSQLKGLKLGGVADVESIQEVYRPSPMRIEITNPKSSYDHVTVDVNAPRKINAANIEKFPQVFCLAQNIYFEAGIESVAGKAAVARVTMNRKNSKKFPNTICDVVWQRKQFSWTHDGKSDRIPSNGRKTWEQSIAVAYDAYYEGKWNGLVEGATHYHADYVSPAWAKKIRRITQIETHIFYE